MIDRLRLAQALDDHDVAELEQLNRVEAALGRISLTRSVLQRASGAFPTTVKTLDALHLASALLLREHENAQVIFATHNDNQALAAKALGF